MENLKNCLSTLNNHQILQNYRHDALFLYIWVSEKCILIKIKFFQILFEIKGRFLNIILYAQYLYLNTTIWYYGETFNY